MASGSTTPPDFAPMQPLAESSDGAGGPGHRSNCNLPLEKVFPIQIGCELFRLSGASIASDAPSYFSRFFEDQLRQSGSSARLRTLYIDRDCETFRDIAQHLQGYYVRPRDGLHFVKLFADAQFYSLPRLISQLFESEIFVQIGNRHFEIPRDIFSSPGDSPNFFTLGFAVFFASPSEVFPGLDRKGLLRPPAAQPPKVPSRSGDVFAELLHMLRGYPLHIRNEEHREELLRDCRYFHLRGLEQKLIPHHISYNPVRGRSEIALRLENIRQSGVKLVVEEGSMQEKRLGYEPRRIMYARPFVEETAHDLILEIGNESTVLDIETSTAKFIGQTMARISSLARVIASKMIESQEQGILDTETTEQQKLETVLSEDGVHIIWDDRAHMTIDGVESSIESLIAAARESQGSETSQPPAKRKKSDSGTRESNRPWIVRTGQWRLTVRKNLSGPWKLKFIAVKLDIYRDEMKRNQTRSFLSGS